ncbi:MAG: DNA gyrase inhibitor YacG [Litorimonas sp.]
MSQTCPVCRKRDAVADYRPFCSKRCADIDLGRWFNGAYAIPTQEPAPEAPAYLPDPANDAE